MTENLSGLTWYKQNALFLQVKSQSYKQTCKLQISSIAVDNSDLAAVF